MNDLPTRLRALADTPYPSPQIQRALREAADAIEARDLHVQVLEASNKQLRTEAEEAHETWVQNCLALEQERDDLKRRLAEVEQERDKSRAHHAADAAKDALLLYQAENERDAALAEAREEHELYLIRTQERDEARAEVDYQKREGEK